MGSLWKSFTSLSPRTRMLIGSGLIAWGLAGSYLTDRAEEAFGMVPTEDDKNRLKGMIPKISTVDREARASAGSKRGTNSEQGIAIEEEELERLRRAAGGAK